MKLNNKGFAITGILYGLLILFALLVGSYLTILTAKKNRLDGIVADIENEYNNKENISTYTLTIEKGPGVSEIYYKVDSDSDYTSSTSNVLLSVNSGSTYSYYGVASSGYTMSSCTSLYPCDETMGTSAVTKTLSASVNSYTLNLNKGTGVSTIYYKINGASNYTSSTSNKSLSVKYNTTYYYYGVASSGYTMSSCTSSNPCSGTMGTSTVTKTLSATSNLSKGFTVTLERVTNTHTVLDTSTVLNGDSYSYSFSDSVSGYTYSGIQCTNGQVATTVKLKLNRIVTISEVTADTTCFVIYSSSGGDVIM